MKSLLINAISFIFIIFLGILLHRKGWASRKESELIRKIILDITLPAAIIANFSKVSKFESAFIFMIVLGFLSNLLMIGLGYILTRHRSVSDRVLYLYGLPAYNLGTFTIPFIQGFVPPEGIVAAFMFDMGNSIMCTGGSYALVSGVLLSTNEKISFKSVRKKIVRSVPIMTYLGLVTLLILGISVPDCLIQLINPIASANAFLAMFYIGLVFRFELKKEYLRDVIKLVLIRQLFAVFFACMIFFVFPFSESVTKALLMVAFSPMSAVAPAFTGMSGGDSGKSSAANSVTILIGLCEIILISMML
jgi:predicted permease